MSNKAKKYNPLITKVWLRCFRDLHGSLAENLGLKVGDRKPKFKRADVELMKISPAVTNLTNYFTQDHVSIYSRKGRLSVTVGVHQKRLSWFEKWFKDEYIYQRETVADAILRSIYVAEYVIIKRYVPPPVLTEITIYLAPKGKSFYELDLNKDLDEESYKTALVEMEID